jgi:hypothetical protein
MRTNPPLAAALSSRGAIVELMLAAVVLGLGVNFLASAAATYYVGRESSLALLGAALALLSISMIARRTVAAGRINQELHGFICFRRETSDLVDVPRYEYASELKGFLAALFAENDAPKRLWEADPVHKSLDFDSTKGTTRLRVTGAGQLLIEATEYFLLDKLSTHLTDYFNSSEIDSSRLHELRREDIAAVVFSNRLLDTFSRPMQERSAFVDQTMSKGSSHEGVVESYANGQMYSKFDLVLPKGASVVRNAPNSISIHTPKFTLTLKIIFDGLNTSLPRDFQERYLRKRQFRAITAYHVAVQSIVEFKRFALLTPTGWLYHQWVDSFLATLERDFSKSAFLDRIQWECALTTTHLVEHAISSRFKERQEGSRKARERGEEDST